MSWPTAMKRKPWRASSTAASASSVEMPAAMPLRSAGVDDRLQRGGVARMVELAGDAHRGREVEVPDPQHVDPLGGRDRLEIVDRADGLDHRDDHQLVVGPAHVAGDVTLVLVDVEDPEPAVTLRRVLRGRDHGARLGGVADERHHHPERAEREHAADAWSSSVRTRTSGTVSAERAPASSGRIWSSPHPVCPGRRRRTPRPRSPRSARARSSGSRSRTSRGRSRRSRRRRSAGFGLMRSSRGRRRARRRRSRRRARRTGGRPGSRTCTRGWERT